MLCKSCGYELKEAHKFCGGCGAKIEVKMSKIQLFLTFTNGDTSETDEQEMEIDIPSQFDSQLNDLENSENLITLYKAIVSEGSPCYQDILQKFTWFII